MAGKKRLRTRGPDRGWVLPGYKYLGPFNSINKGTPSNPTDQAALVHDNDYYHLEKAKKKPKLQYSEADDTFLESIKNEKDWGASIARWVFNKKKKLAEHGTLTDLRPTKWAKAGETKNDASLFLSPERVKKKPGKKGISPEDKKKPTIKNAEPRSRAAEGQRNIMAKQVATGSGLEAGLSETPIDAVSQVHRGPANYCFASLPHHELVNIATTAYTIDITRRMTSCYDTNVSGTSTDYNAGAGTATYLGPVADSADASASKARWFDYYAGIYKYYHVVSARWKMTIENHNNDMLWCHWMYHNDVSPPVGATNLDILNWQGVHSNLIGSHAVAITSAGITERNDEPANAANDEDQAAVTTANYETGNHVTRRGPAPICILSGEYQPGDYNREIRLDSEVENWTLTTANPALTERLTFRFKNWNEGIGDNDALSYDRPLNFTYRYEIEYLVEFKELKDGLIWPVSKQPLTVTISTNVN